jgi:long-chain acyl-CoA synthetase
VAADTIPARLVARAKQTPNAPAYYERSPDGLWKGSSWGDYAGQVEQAGRALMALGVEPGQAVAILGFNRAEWVVFDVAAMSVGAAPAGIYTTCSPTEVRYIVEHAEAPVVLVENEHQWDKVRQERQNLPNLRHVVTMRGTPAIDDELVLSWDEFLAKAENVSPDDFHARIEGLEPTQCATMIYTSGTTGPPKAVMLSQRNLVWTADIANQIAKIGPEDSSLSYLPLSHIAEQMFTIHIPIVTGGQIYYAESIDRLRDNLSEVRPTVFFGVPRIWEKFHDGIAAKLQEATGVKAKLASWALDVGRRVTAVRSEGKEPTGLLAMQYELARRLVFDKVKAAVGLDRARICVSGAAPVAKEVLEFLGSLDLIILEVYGQSEDSGPTTFNRPDRFRLGTVGPPLPGVEVETRDDGEVCVRGPNVFLGYFKDPAATTEALIDGWLHSGDLGEFDDDGFLRITGRKKDLIITAGGKNIAPKNIEQALKNHPLINEAVVVGDRRKYLSALLTLDGDGLAAWARERGLDVDAARKGEELQKELQRAVDEVNLHLARVEQVKRFTVLPRDLTIDAGELTPTLKVKRNVVMEHFSDEIERLYE